MIDVVEPTLVRPPFPSDQSYVASTWWHSLIGGGELNRSEAQNLVDVILERGDTRIKVAAKQGDPTAILGWIVYVPRPLVLHYVYVRSKHRGAGIAHMLFSAAGFDDARVLVWTLEGPSASWLVTKHPNVVHVPIREFIL